MWDFFKSVFETTGFVGLISLIEVGLLILLLKSYQTKDNKIHELENDLLVMSEKRREDAIEERERYHELSEDLHKAMDLLIKVFKKYNGNAS